MAVLVGSEGVHSAVYRIALPAEAIAADAAAAGTPTSRPTNKPVPTVKPTVNPTATAPTLTVLPNTQSPSPVETSLPASSVLSSFEAPSAAPASSALVSTLHGPSEAASSNGRSPSTSASHSSLLLWVVLAVVVCGLGVLLVLAQRFRWWPWGRP